MNRENDSDAYYGLRQIVFQTSPNKISIKPSEEFPSVYGVLMEIGMSEAAVSLVALADGTVSLYYETGGGVIGGGGHENVKNAGSNFIKTAEGLKENFAVARNFPLPDRGRIKFYLLTF